MECLIGSPMLFLENANVDDLIKGGRGVNFSVSRKLFSMLLRIKYDRGVNTFSPKGILFQVEYAIEAIKLGSTTIGIETKKGVVLAVEKRNYLLFVGICRKGANFRLAIGD